MTIIVLALLWAACVIGSAYFFQRANRPMWQGLVLTIILGGILGLFISLLVFMFGKRPPPTTNVTYQQF
jgi:RsiW-degrading membrane proteinase PrsW (M82 family)